MTTADEQNESGMPVYTPGQMVRYSLQLGTIGFGGPVALVGYMHRDLVERRKWISESEYKEGLTLAQLMPGPLAAQLAIYLGYVHYGVLGATLVGVTFVLPWALRSSVYSSIRSFEDDTGVLAVKKWLILIYRIPREPTAARVFVWRKLKQLGAIAVQDAAWVLPQTPRTQEQFQWLAAEISELEGDALLWEAEHLYATDPESLRRQFLEPVEAEYRRILAALRKKDRDLTLLSKQYQDTHARDYFESEVGRQVREKLLAAGGG